MISGVSLSAVGTLADSMHAHLSLCLTSVALVLLREVVPATDLADWQVAASDCDVAKLLTLLTLGRGRS